MACCMHAARRWCCTAPAEPDNEISADMKTPGIAGRVLFCLAVPCPPAEALLRRDSGDPFAAAVDAAPVEDAGAARQGDARRNNVIQSRCDGIRDRQLTGRGIGKEAVAANPSVDAEYLPVRQLEFQLVFTGPQKGNARLLISSFLAIRRFPEMSAAITALPRKASCSALLNSASAAA